MSLGSGCGAGRCQRDFPGCSCAVAFQALGAAGSVPSAWIKGQSPSLPAAGRQRQSLWSSPFPLPVASTGGSHALCGCYFIYFFFFKSGVLFLLAGWLLASFQLISSCLSAAPGPAWVSQLRSVHWWGEHVSCMFKGPRLCTPISPTWRADPSVGCGEPGWGCPCFLSLDASARPRIWVLVLCSLQEQDRRIPRVPWGIKGCRSCSCRSLALGCCFLWRGGWAAVGMPGVQCSCSLGLSGVSVCHLDCVTDPQLDRAS